jgi:hypothetical protein
LAPTYKIPKNKTNLYPDPSSTPSTIIVALLGIQDVFCILTVDTSLSQGEMDTGLSHFIGDLPSKAGNGSVLKKSIIPPLAYSTEKLTAAPKNYSCQPIWLLTLASAGGKKNSFNTQDPYEDGKEFKDHFSLKRETLSIL